MLQQRVEMLQQSWLLHMWLLYPTYVHHASAAQRLQLLFKHISYSHSFLKISLPMFCLAGGRKSAETISSVIRFKDST